MASVAEPAAAGLAAPAAAALRLRGMVVGMLLGLLLQYAVGMLVNLFVTVPVHHPGHDSADFFAGVVAVVPWAIRHGGPLAIHTALGLLLVVNGIFIFVRTLGLGQRALRWLTGVGALVVLGAGFNGASFLIYTHDQSSLIMAWLFAIALLCYILCLLRLPAR